MSKRNGITKICKCCGKQYYVQAHRAEKSLFCSMQCLWNGRPPRKKNLISRVCEACGSIYYVQMHRVETTRFCSAKCNAFTLRQKSTELLRISAINAKYDVGRSERELERIEKKRECDRRYYKNNIDRAKVASAYRYKENKEKYKEKNRQWRIKNADSVREKNKIKRDTDGEKIRQARREHYLNNKARYKASARRRDINKKNATPPWVDFEKIVEFYKKSEQLTLETGVKYHVDHIYPLNGKDACGLHVPWNLQVIPAIDNLRKSNRMPTESQLIRYGV